MTEQVHDQAEASIRFIEPTAPVDDMTEEQFNHAISMAVLEEVAKTEKIDSVFILYTEGDRYSLAGSFPVETQAQCDRLKLILLEAASNIRPMPTPTEQES